MPPKSSTAASKRKAKDESDGSAVDSGSEVEEKPKKAAKKAKPKEPVTPLDASLPTNLTLPDKMEFARPVEGAVRLSAWNITSINSSVKKVGAGALSAWDDEADRPRSHRAC